VNLKEALRLVAWATANFPQLQERDMRPTAELWAKMLGDIPYQLAEKALMKVLATARYFPTVAEIREAAAELQHGRPMTADEAWGLVAEAVRRYGYYREQEALASLPPEVAVIVRRFGWQEICACEEPDVIRGQFRRAWEINSGQAREIAVLPAPIRELIEAHSATMALPEPKPRKLPEPPKSLPGPPAPDNVVFLHLERVKKVLAETEGQKLEGAREIINRMKQLLPGGDEPKESTPEQRVVPKPKVTTPILEQLRQAEERGDQEAVADILRKIAQGDAVNG
jgi:hypothetical protein